MRYFLFLLLTPFATFAAIDWEGPQTVTASSPLKFDLDFSMNVLTAECIATWGKITSNFVQTVEASYFNGSAWGATQTLASNLAVRHPSVSFDALSGNALEMQVSKDIVNGHFYSGGNWSAFSNLDTLEFPASAKPEVSYFNGRGVGVYIKNASTTYEVRATFFGGTSFSSPVTITSGSGAAADPHIVRFNTPAAALASWTAPSGGINTIQTSRFNGDVWEPFETLSTPGNEALSSQLAINPVDNVITAVWSEREGGNYLVKASRYEAGVWSTATTLSMPGQDALNAQVAVDENTGLAYVVWQRSNGTHTLVQARLYDGEVASAIFTLSSSESNGELPQVAVNPVSGHAVTVWGVTGGGPILSAFYNGTSWTSPQDISGGSGVASKPQVGFSFGGQAVAVWIENNLIRSNTGMDTQLAPEPPTDFRGFQRENRFLIESDLINYLFWEPSPSSSVVGYVIRKNGVSVATITGTSYTEHHVPRHIQIGYTISAIDEDGNESDPLLLMLPQ